MAYFYGPEVSHWRAYGDYSTSQTDTSVTIALSGGAQSIGWGFAVGYVDCTVTVNGQSATTYNNDFDTASGSTTAVQMASKAVAVTRTHSAQTVTISVTTYNHSGYADGTSTASTTVTVPARPSYTVAYNANNGSGAPSAQTKWYGETLTLSSTRPTRTGYTFQGWATTSTATSAAYSAGGSYTANAAVTLYTVWRANTYTVSYNANNGTGAPASQTKTYGVTLTLSSTKPTRTGYTFQGWATSSTATSATYSAGGSYTANASAVLYAVWKATTWTVSYVANGGSTTPASQTKTSSAAITLASAISRASSSVTYTVTLDAGASGASTGDSDNKLTATKTTSYTFYKWKSTAGTLYDAGASYTLNQSTTMTAQWTPRTSGGTVTLPTPTWSGYSCTGWYTSGGTKVGNAGASYTPTASITLYARWTRATYEVAYNANGGSGAPAAQTKTHGTPLTLSTTRPRRSGYEFLGWSTNATGTGTAYAPGQSYTANAAVTLYAVWAGVQVTSLTVYRCTSDGTKSYAGTYGRLSAPWKAMGTIAGTVSITATQSGAAIPSDSISNNSGSKTATADLTATSVAIFGGSYVDSDMVRVTVTATMTVTYAGATHTVTATRSATIPRVFRLMSFAHSETAYDGFNEGMAIGLMASLIGRLEVGLQTIFRKAVSVADATLSISSANLDRGGTDPLENQYGKAFRLSDTNGDAIGMIDAFQDMDGTTGIRMTAFNDDGSGNAVYDGFRVGEKKGGGAYYYATDPAAFRNAINAVACGDQSSMNARLTSLTSTNQQWTLRATVTNSANSHAGNKTGLLLNDSEVVGYDFTSQSTMWSAITTATSVYKSTTASQVITAASGRTVSSVTYAEWGKVAMLSVTVSGFAASTGSQSVGTVVSGKRPVYAVYATDVSSSYAVYGVLNADGTLNVYWGTAPSTSTGYVVRFIYLLA